MSALRLLLLLVSVILIINFIHCKSTALTSAKLYLQQENYPKAIEYFQEELQANPQNDEVHYLIGLCYANQIKFEKMNEHFKESLAISNKFQKDITFFQKRYWISFFNVGLEKLKDNHFDDAINYFNTAIVIDPNETRTYKNLAFLFIKQEDHSKVIENYKKVIDLDPNDHRTLLSLGIEYYNIKKYSDSVDMMREILSKDPENIDAIVYLALSYDQLGNSEKALEIYNTAIGLIPAEVDLYFNRGRLFYSDKKYENALKDFEKVLEIKPDDVESKINIGGIYFKLGDIITEQIKIVEEQKVDPQKIEKLREKEKEYYKRSKEIFEKLVPQNPQYHDFWYSLAMVYFRLGMPDEGEKALKNAAHLKIGNKNLLILSIFLFLRSY